MRLARNTLYTLLSTLLPAVLSIATIPLFVGQIGAERYGTLAIAWLLLGYFGTADFGIGRAITQRISSMRGEGHAAMADAVWSALVAAFVFALLFAAALWLLAAWYFAGVFEVEQGLRSEILAAVWLLALCNPVYSLSGVLTGSLMGLERFRMVALGNGLANTLLLLLPLAASWLLDIRMTTLIAAALAARVLGALLLGLSVWRTFLHGQRLHFRRAEFQRLLGFGAWIMLSSLIGPLMLYADRLVIGAFQNAAAVAAYAIPYQIANRTLILPTALMQALFPRFAAEDDGASQQRCHHYTNFMALTFAPVIVPLICLAGPLLSLWLGQDLDPRSALVGQVLLAGMWINGAAFVPFTYIQARSDPRFTALLHLAELPFYLVVLALAASLWGLTGIALAFAIRCAIDCLLLLRRARILDRAMLGQVVPSLLLVLAALAAGQLLDTWPALFGAAVVLGGLAVLALLRFMPQSIRSQLAGVPLIAPVLRWRIGGG